MSYGGDVNRGPFLNVINWVFCSITLAVLVLRLFSRRLLEKSNWQIDDAFVALPVAVILTRAIYISVCVGMGFGQHLHALLEEDPVATIKLTRLLVILEAISLWTWTLPKIPVVILLIRLFGQYKKHIGPILYSLVGFLIVWVTILTIVTFVQCNPVALTWNPMLKGTCWDPKIYLDLGYFAGAYSASLDFGFAVYPIFQISNLQMEKSRKILTAMSLGLGIPAGIVTIYKLSTIAALTEAGDPTWATVPLEVWNSVESFALVLAAAIPMSRPVMVLITKNLIAFTSRVTGSSRGTSKPRSDAKYPEDSGFSRIHDSSSQPTNGPWRAKTSDEILLEEMRVGGDQPIHGTYAVDRV